MPTKYHKTRTSFQLQRSLRLKMPEQSNCNLESKAILTSIVFSIVKQTNITVIKKPVEVEQTRGNTSVHLQNSRLRKLKIISRGKDQLVCACQIGSKCQYMALIDRYRVAIFMPKLRYICQVLGMYIA